MVIQPLFLGVLVIALIFMPLSANNSKISVIYAIIITFLCIAAFLAGWYNCVKYTISLKDKVYETPEESNKSQIEILKNFFPGVSEYILPVTGALLLYFGIGYGLFYAYQSLALPYAAKALPSEFLNLLNTASQAEIAQYLQQNFSPEQLKTLTLLLAGGVVLYIVFTVLLLWLAPALIYTSKNPFVAIFNAVKFTFKHFGMSLAIIFVMFLINMILSFTNSFLSSPILAFIPILLSFIYIMYYVMTVFLYYETETQNNSDSGAECIG